jgi:ElaB/YqjD/DUF883 family membrane-anchored ribosome-binding protein
MFSNKPAELSNHLADGAAHDADDAIKATQRLASEALDSLSDSVKNLRQQAAPLFNSVQDEANSLTQRGLDAMRDSSRHLRNQARQASDHTVDYIKHEPMKSILIAAATGAALMALIGLVTRSSGRR